MLRRAVALPPVDGCLVRRFAPAAPLVRKAGRMSWRGGRVCSLNERTCCRTAAAVTRCTRCTMWLSVATPYRRPKYRSRRGVWDERHAFLPADLRGRPPTYFDAARFVWGGLSPRLDRGRRVVSRSLWRTLVAALGFIRFQWLALLLMLVAGALLVATVHIRNLEEPDQSVLASSIAQQQFGVLVNSDTAASISRRLYSGEPLPEELKSKFSLRIGAGDRWTGSYFLILLGDLPTDKEPFVQINIFRPLRFGFVLPHGARVEGDRGIVPPDPPGACASWYGNGTSGKAFPREIDLIDSRVLVCEVPPVGVVEQLFVGFAFTWDNAAQVSAGIGKTRTVLRLPSVGFSLAGTPPEVSDTIGSDVNVRLELRDGKRLLESFPSPTGGTSEERSWTMQHGDLDLTMVDPRQRRFVQPALDLTLLLGGAAVGALPAAIRRRRPDTSRYEESSNCASAALNAVTAPVGRCTTMWDWRTGVG